MGVVQKKDAREREKPCSVEVQSAGTTAQVMASLHGQGTLPLRASVSSLVKWNEISSWLPWELNKLYVKKHLCY